MGFQGLVSYEIAKPKLDLDFALAKDGKQDLAIAVMKISVPYDTETIEGNLYDMAFNEINFATPEMGDLHQTLDNVFRYESMGEGYIGIEFADANGHVRGVMRNVLDSLGEREGKNKPVEYFTHIGVATYNKEKHESVEDLLKEASEDKDFFKELSNDAQD